MPTVLVTGAARGLGAEFVKQYAEDGWHVLACARDSGRITSQSNVESLELDVASEVSMESLADAVGDKPVDVLINCAGTMGKFGFADGGLEADAFGRASWDNWHDILKINLFAPMLLSELLLSNVEKSDQKKIVTLTSILGSMGKNNFGGLYAYRASKAGVNAIMKSMSVDLVKRDVIAVAMHPGWVQTDMGGGQADIDSATSVTGMRSVISGLTQDHSGGVWMYDGTELPW
ncbi:MAG: SDR family oxidoreductase [Pseudomonadota bacterium]